MFVSHTTFHELIVNIQWDSIFSQVYKNSNMISLPSIFVGQKVQVLLGFCNFYSPVVTQQHSQWTSPIESSVLSSSSSQSRNHNSLVTRDAKASPRTCLRLMRFWLGQLKSWNSPGGDWSNSFQSFFYSAAAFLTRPFIIVPITMIRIQLKFGWSVTNGSNQQNSKCHRNGTTQQRNNSHFLTTNNW
jgi:hypothetical protein